jgi:hypothetical protein
MWMSTGVYRIIADAIAGQPGKMWCVETRKEGLIA